MKQLADSFSLFFLLSLICSVASAQSSIPIRETTPYPDSVLYSNSASLPNGNVIVWGGQKQVQTPSGKVWISRQSYIYDYVEETWNEGPELATEVLGALVVPMANGNILSIGGQGYATIAGIDSLPMRTDAVQMLDVSSMTWSLIDSIPFGESPYTGTSGHLLPDSNVWMTTTNGDYGTLDHETLLWTDHNGLFGPLDAGGRPIVTLDNGIIFHTGAGGQYYDMANQLITYADPVIPMHPDNVVKLPDGRILTWEDGFSFSQQAIMVSANGLGSTFIDSLVIPGQSTTGVLMPDGKVWVFGLGEIGFPPLTLLQIFDPATDTWSSPGTYDFRPEILIGYHMHRLPDTSIVVITTQNDNTGESFDSYRINADGTTSIQGELSFLPWEIQMDQTAQQLRLIPTGLTEPTAFQLLDMQGRVLSTATLTEEQAYELNDLSAGIYVARLTQANGAMMMRKIRVW